MSTFRFLCAAYGVCFGLMNDKAPFLPLLRKLPLFPDKDGQTFFSRMFGCPYCTGFHAGWLVWAVTRLQEHLAMETGWVLTLGDALAHAFAASAFCYVADIVAQWVEEASS